MARTASCASRIRSTCSAGRRSRCRRVRPRTGCPSSVQIVGRPGDDALVLAAGLALEEALRGALRRISRSRTRWPTRPTRSRWRASARAISRVETKPDLTPVSEADRAAEQAIRALVERDRDGEGVYGEEFGDDGGDGALDRRPDRRDDELRARHPGLGDAARARTGRASSRSAWCRRRRSAAAGGRRAAAARGPARPSARASAAASHPSRASRTASRRPRPRARCRPGWAEVVRRAWAIRGLSDFWQHCLVAEGVLDVAADPGTQLWDYAAVAAHRRGGGRPLHDVRRRATRARAERGSPPTDSCTTSSEACSRRRRERRLRRRLFPAR